MANGGARACSWCAAPINNAYNTKRNYCSVVCRRKGSPFFYANPDAVLPDGVGSFSELSASKRTEPVPAMPKMIAAFGSLDAAAEVFWPKSARGDGCWKWMLSPHKGYGRWKVVRGGVRYVWAAHRAAFVLHHRREPVGDVVRHTCDNPLCVNPAHLEEGSYQDNAIDAARRGRLSGQVLDAAKVRVVRAAVSGGANPAEVAEVLGVSATAIRRIVKQIDWAWVA